MAVYSNVLSGCDFLTPFSFAKKPDCKFCRMSSVNWEHLLFQCPDSLSGLPVLEKVLKTVDSYRNDTTGVQKTRLYTLKRTIVKLWNQKNYTTLFHVLLGINLHNYNLNFLNIISLLVRTTSKILCRIEHEWTYMVPN